MSRSLGREACDPPPLAERFEAVEAGGEGGAATGGRDEEVAQGREDRDEALQPSRRAEALYLPFALSKRHVAALGPVVEALVGAVLERGARPPAWRPRRRAACRSPSAVGASPASSAAARAGGAPPSCRAGAAGSRPGRCRVGPRPATASAPARGSPRGPRRGARRRPAAAPAAAARGRGPGRTLHSTCARSRTRRRCPARAAAPRPCAGSAGSGHGATPHER